MDTDLSRIKRVAPVELFDESHGLFGEMIPPEVVLQGLRNYSNLTGNVGQLDDPTAAQATQAIHSFLCIESTAEVCVEFENTTSLPISVRWLDESGRTFPHFNFTLEAFSSSVRYSRLGHLFLLSVAAGGGGGGGGAAAAATAAAAAAAAATATAGGEERKLQDEELLGAYRIRMPLPSQSPHYLRVEQTGVTTATHNTASYILESVLADPTGEDELVVAAEALDTVGAGPDHLALTKTIHTLATILQNLRLHPTDPKFHSLRLSNAKIQHHIASCWGAMHLLKTVGFHSNKEAGTGDDYLTWNKAHEHDFEAQQKKLDRAIQLLDQLKTRAQPGFVAELAPRRPPWQGPILSSSSQNAGRQAFGTASTHFLSDDEKWARAERNRTRRGRSGRRPDPGNAPSSNGAWGR